MKPTSKNAMATVITKRTLWRFRSLPATRLPMVKEIMDRAKITVMPETDQSNWALRGAMTTE